MDCVLTQTHGGAHLQTDKTERQTTGQDSITILHHPDSPDTLPPPHRPPLLPFYTSPSTEDRTATGKMVGTSSAKVESADRGIRETGSVHLLHPGQSHVQSASGKPNLHHFRTGGAVSPSRSSRTNMVTVCSGAAHSGAGPADTVPGPSLPHNAFTHTSTADGSGRLFSDLTKVLGTAVGSKSPASEGSRGKEAGAAGTLPVRVDHLCNQHLIPEQLRKLIVPDMEKMMQLGRDNAWDHPPDPQPAASGAGGQSGAKTQPAACFSAGEKGAQHAATAQHTAEGCARAPATTGQGASQGFHITAEELFANYEAAVIGSRSSQTGKPSVYKAGPPTEEASGSEARKKASAAGGGGVGGLTVSCCALPAVTAKPAAMDSVRYHSQAAKGGGQSLGRGAVEHKPPLYPPPLPAVSRHSTAGVLPPPQQQQAVTFSGKSREQVMTTATYYSNTRLSDVMTYASINIPGLPRIPILSPQAAAAQNAFLLKASSMRPCLQPNLSVPPPGFIPLMPMPAGPPFHHQHHGPGPGAAPAAAAYPMGPVFQPGMFHSPNFIAMTPPPPPAPTFMQQTKVNICANVNINSSVSATFNINGSNNRGDGHAPTLALSAGGGGGFRGGNSASSAASSTAISTATTTTCTAGDPGARCAVDSCAPVGRPTNLAGWTPLAPIKLAAPAPAPGKAGESVSGPDSLLRGSHASVEHDVRVLVAARHKADGKDDVSGRGEVERGRGGGGGGGGGGPSGGEGTVNRPRGSNTDNLIHVFPRRM